jgi:hypothetical protein
MWKCKECGDEIKIVPIGETYTMGRDGELLQVRGNTCTIGRDGEIIQIITRLVCSCSGRYIRTRSKEETYDFLREKAEWVEDD